MLKSSGHVIAGAVAGLLLGLLPASGALANVTYTYDSLGRLASAAYDSGVTLYYSYDLNGNRLTRVVQNNGAIAVWGSFTWGLDHW